MAAAVDSLTAADQNRLRRPRNQPISTSDPNPQIPSLIQSTRCKPTISSLFLSPFTANTTNLVTNINSNSDGSNVSLLLKKKKNFSSATFMGLGCTTSSQVSAPAVIRSSADWQDKKVRKKKQRKPSRKKNHQAATNPTSVVVVPDVWCAPGITFATDASSVDCVVSRRPVAGRGRADGERVCQRERSCTVRRTANLDHITVLDSPSAFETTRSGSDVFGARNYRHFRHRSPEGLEEFMVLHSSMLLGGRSDGYDRYRDWRLDVDNMTYEELIELGDRIGYVSTGLREEEIFRCLRKSKLSVVDPMPSQFPIDMEWKCSICQEEYEDDDEVGKLDCGHGYHIYCIKQWLSQKNACPVCKAAAVSQY